MVFSVKVDCRGWNLFISLIVLGIIAVLAGLVATLNVQADAGSPTEAERIQVASHSSYAASQLEIQLAMASPVVPSVLQESVSGYPHGLIPFYIPFLDMTVTVLT